MMQQQFGGGPTPELQQPPVKLFASEKDNFDIIHHKWDLAQTEQRLLKKLASAKM